MNYRSGVLISRKSGPLHFTSLHWNLNQKSSISNVETQEGKSFESTRRVTDRAISQRVTRSHEMREEWGGAEKSVEHRPTSGGRDDSSRG